MKAISSQSSLLFLVIFTSLFIVGCGQSGVLYLPEEQPTKNQSSEQQKNKPEKATPTQKDKEQ